jgi:DNA (cytosine-5)-methyltransferase 1
MKTLKFGSDFSGIGAPELALKNLNIPIKKIFACEIDKFARKSFTAIHGDEGVFYNDITKRNHSEVEKLDLYVAGFPCQAFSMAGSRKGFDDVRGTLFFNVAEFIKINKPECFVLENVKGLISHDSGKTFQTILSLLSDGGGTVNKQMFIPYFTDGLGYHIYYTVLNTKDFEIPQNRERVFIVGFKKFRNFSFPVAMPLKLKLKDFLQNNPDYKYFLSDKMIKNFLNRPLAKNYPFQPLNINSKYSPCLTARYYKMAATDPYIKMPIDDKYFLSDKIINYFTKKTKKQKEKGNGFKFDPTNGESVAKTITTKEGQRIDDNYIIINSNNKKSIEKAQEGDSVDFEQPNSKTRRGRVQKQISHTIQTAMIPGVLLSGRIRRLTPLECFRLQGFDDESFFRAQKVNSDTQLYKQAGNSITVNVLMKIFEKIYNDEYNSEKS